MANIRGLSYNFASAIFHEASPKRPTEHKRPASLFPRETRGVYLTIIRLCAQNPSHPSSQTHREQATTMDFSSDDTIQLPTDGNWSATPPPLPPSLWGGFSSCESKSPSHHLVDSIITELWIGLEVCVAGQRASLVGTRAFPGSGSSRPGETLEKVVKRRAD